VIGRLKLALAAAGAFIVALFAAYWNGKSKAKDEGYADTRKRMDEVDLGNDPDAARRFLHERGQR
jgi:hypothetical protein